MILYLIRHAHAEDREISKCRDMDRPLTEKGKAKALTAFKNFMAFSEKPEVVISSCALRCVETAAILGTVTGIEPEADARLNPGATVKDFLEVISGKKMKNVIAVIGHEPDLSEVIAFITGNKGLRLMMKKGSICHIEDGVLINLIQQKVLL